MSTTFLIPVKFKCDMAGCDATAIGMCACEETPGLRLISPEITEPNLPEGWTQNYYGEHWCKSCSEMRK